MNQITALIQSAVPRVVNKRDGGQITLNEVFINGQAYTARKPVFDQASMLVGQIAQLTVRSETNDRGYTNHYLDGVMQQMQTQPVAQPSQPQIAPQVTTNLPTDKDRSIWRQCATKVAAQLLSPSDGEATFWNNVDRLMQFYETGQKPNTEQASNPVSNPMSSVGQVGGYTTDSDIPFSPTSMDSGL